MATFSPSVICVRCSKATTSPLECVNELHSTCDSTPLCGDCVVTCGGCGKTNSCVDCGSQCSGCEREGVAPGAKNFFCEQDCGTNWYNYCLCDECKSDRKSHKGNTGGGKGIVPLLEATCSNDAHRVLVLPTERCKHAQTTKSIAAFWKQRYGMRGNANPSSQRCLVKWAQRSPPTARRRRRSQSPIGGLPGL